MAKTLKEKVYDRIRIEAESKGRNRFITDVAAITTIEDIKEFLTALMEEIL